MYYDVVKFETNFEPMNYGFHKIVNYEKKKERIKHVKNLQEAVNYRNKKILLVLEEYDIEEGALKLIGEKQEACFLIDLSRILKNSGLARTLEMARIRTFIKFCKKYGVKFSFASFSTSERVLRNARELIHIGLLLDLGPDEAKNALKIIKDYVD